MPFEFGDVVLVRFPFTDQTSQATPTDSHSHSHSVASLSAGVKPLPSQNALVVFVGSGDAGGTSANTQ